MVTGTKATQTAGQNSPQAEQVKPVAGSGETVMSVRTALDQAIKLYTSGKIPSAERLVSQILALIECISAQMINHSNAVDKTHTDLGAKLGFAARLSSDNRPDMRLVDTDDTIITAMCSALIHG